MKSAPSTNTRRRAFTLIELLAVLLIMGLVVGITLPNLALGTERALLAEAEQLASRPRLHAPARGRHRHTASRGGRSRRRGLVDRGVAGGGEPVRRRAARHAGRAARGPARGAAATVGEPAPLPGPLGHPHALPEGMSFESVETQASGLAADGQVEIVFEGDGSAEPALFALVNESGDAVRLQLSRLADEIRISRE